MEFFDGEYVFDALRVVDVFDRLVHSTRLPCLQVTERLVLYYPSFLNTIYLSDVTSICSLLFFTLMQLSSLSGFNLPFRM